MESKKRSLETIDLDWEKERRLSFLSPPKPSKEDCEKAKEINTKKYGSVHFYTFKIIEEGKETTSAFDSHDLRSPSRREEG